MDKNKKAKIITLIATVAVIAVGVGTYLMNRPKTSDEPLTQDVFTSSSVNTASDNTLSSTTLETNSSERTSESRMSESAPQSSRSSEADAPDSTSANSEISATSETNSHESTPDNSAELDDSSHESAPRNPVSLETDVPESAQDNFTPTESAPTPESSQIPVDNNDNAEVDTNVEINDNFILLTGGAFIMGSPDGERQRGKDELSHTVTLNPFYVDPYEVTQRDYSAVTGKNPSVFKGDNLPVDNVTWFDAVEYCNKLSERRGLTPVYQISGNTVTWNRSANGYRLLTEAEWEYAARAGTSTIYNFGDQVHSNLANFQGSYPYLIEENYVTHRDPLVVTSRSRGTTIAVNELAPNAFGLYNTHGNVSEWCFDYYGEYGTQNAANPAGAASGALRVNRGGGYNDFGKHLRSAYRSATNPVDADQNLGFRICRNAEPINDIVTTTYSLDINIPENPKVLVAYFSYSGNTENAAEIIRDKTGADLFEITMENPYRGNIYEVSQRDLMSETRPPLAGRVENMDEYDVILLGYPTWWATMPMTVYTFLESYDLSGKTIISFSSHGGTMFGDSVSDLSKSAPNSYVGIGFEFNYSGGSGLSDEISEWLTQSGIPQR